MAIEVTGGDRLGQPDPVVAAVEAVAVPCHGFGVDGEDDHPTRTAAPDPMSGVHVDGQVDVVAAPARPIHLAQ